MNAIPNRRPWNFEHRFFLVALVVLFAVVFAGFARTYYLKFLFGTPALPWLMQLHGALMTSWFALFFTQTCLIASHRLQWHKRLGVLGAMLALAILMIAPIVFVNSVDRELHTPQGNPAITVIFGFDLMILVDFALLAGSALALRRRSGFHKRLMLLATCSIIMPAIGRLPISPNTMEAVFYACVFVPVIVDTVLHRRLHPAFGWGAPLLAATEVMAVLGARTHAWHDFVVRSFA